MKRVAYLLTLLVFWAQFDDVLLAPASVLQAAPVVGDDDEYVPPEHQAQEKRSVSRPCSVSVPVNAERGASSGFLGTGAFSAKVFSRAVSPPLLYLLMSLQC
jgi:hypothetical protein